jgi:hypothetical protein
MLLFLDCEFTDFIDCELISVGMVSDDGRYELYLEVVDFDRSKCNAFVQSAVWRQLGRIEGAQIRRSEIKDRLTSWLAAIPGEITIAADSQHDRDLLMDALDGEWPDNFWGWFDLRPAVESAVFQLALAQYHTPDKPWHHALHDAQANRAGWLQVAASISPG